MSIIHLVTHTHWDREWYLTFQQFRLKLTKLLDLLLEILNTQPEFKYFLLDGQAIILEDYLQVRPEKREELQKHISSGRILIGPWYISPDEFLVAPESHIRNLLEGRRICQEYGARMMVGYLPDIFGHIGQLPQILQGFGIDTACLWRGLDDQPCELYWIAPDGSKVILAYLRESYSNAANLTPAFPERFLKEVGELTRSLEPHSLTGHLLLMNGTDHMEPSAKLAEAISAYQTGPYPDQLLHSSLPLYFESLRLHQQTSGAAFPEVIGELRASKRTHLLQSVLSTHIDIKQRNHACEDGLLKWAEPLSAWADLLEEDTGKSADNIKDNQRKYLKHHQSIIRHAWKLLMECHPHDSICGTSIDQVIREMGIRFDQVDQINERLIDQSLQRICEQADTRFDHTQQVRTSASDILSPVVVFNPNDATATGIAAIQYKLPYGYSAVEVIDEAGNIAPLHLTGMGARELINMLMDKKALKQALGMINEGNVAGFVIKRFELQRQGSQAVIEVTLSDHGQVIWEDWKQSLAKVEAALADPMVNEFLINAKSDPEVTLSFLAKAIPGHGYRCYWIRGISQPVIPANPPVKPSSFIRLLMPVFNWITRFPLFSRLITRRRLPRSRPPYKIENEYFTVEARITDGTLSVTDKRTHQVYHGLNYFLDGGDCGDLYNYSPPQQDQLFKAQIGNITYETNELVRRIIIHYRMDVPRSISENRRTRSRQLVQIDLDSEITLLPGVPRIDIVTKVDNRASDHRLRVHFPAPFMTSSAWYDGHFEIVERPIRLPAYDNTWVEPPRPEKPQREFTSINDDQLSMMVANRGLPEVETYNNPAGQTEIALTLLRCVGWLSRDDLATRNGHAGPMGIATPDAQMHGKHTFAYSIIPGDGDWRKSIEQARSFNCPLRTVEVKIHPGNLASTCSMVENSNKDFLITSIKNAEDVKGLIVRGVNLLACPIDISLKPWRPFQHAHLVRLDESKIQELVISSLGGIRLRLEGHKIATILFSN